MSKIIQISTGQFLIGECRTVTAPVNLDSPFAARKTIAVDISHPYEVIPVPVDGQNGQASVKALIVPYAPMCKERAFTFSIDKIILGPVEADENCVRIWEEHVGLIKAQQGSAEQKTTHAQSADDVLIKG